RGLVRFDIAACAIPTSATVTSATITMPVRAFPVVQAVYDLRLLGADWCEAAPCAAGLAPVTWSTTPGVVAGPASSAVVDPALPHAPSWDVTSAVSFVVSGGVGSFGWMVLDHTEDDFVGRQASFAGRESGQAGTLAIAY